MTGTIHYAAFLLLARDSGERVERARQSSDAGRLLDAAASGLVPTATSKSHSRAAIAAAAGDGEGLSLGIDIEWMAPDRPFATIARVFLKSVPAEMGPEEFYRGWTFGEAYFKAFGSLPPQSAIGDIVAARGEISYLDDGICVLHRRVFDIFLLCVVWRASQPYTLQYISAGRVFT